MRKITVNAGRDRLARLHGRGERVDSVARAVAMVVGGVVTCIGGLRELLDAVSPSAGSDED